MSQPSALPASNATRHAWLTLGGAFASFAVGASMLHAYSVFLLAFIKDFGWSRGEASIAYAVSQLVTGIGSPVIGLAVDRFGTRRVVIAGFVMLTVGLFASAQANALWQVVVLYGVVMTMGVNCLGMVALAPLLSRMFVRRRGMAFAVVQGANGFGRAVSTPAAQLLVSLMSWRSAYFTQACIMAALTFPLGLIFRGADTRAAATPQAEAGVASRQWTLKEAIVTLRFWLLFTVYMCTGLGSFFVSLHQLAFAVDRGFDPLYAAFVLGVGALLSTPGVILTGYMSDIIGRELAGASTYAISILGVGAALFIEGPGDHLLLWVHACLFGVTWGARGPTITAKTADLFPGGNLGAILGVITIGSGLGAAIGSWGAGVIFDLSGSYRLAFILSIVSYMVGAVAFWALRRPVT